jgi:hypothetical protein
MVLQMVTTSVLGATAQKAMTWNFITSET